MQRRGSRHIWLRVIGLFAVLALVASACGGDDDDDATGGGDGDGQPRAEEGEPQYGGRIVYGLEAETSGGWCLAEAQLAISGIQVARTIYDTLTVPNGEGEIEPYLAESVEANDDFTEWTITLREGVTFHDGSDLTAEVVKNNLDAYRGAYEGRNPLLFTFVFGDITAVEVVDPLTVRVTTGRPWRAFDWYLHSSGRLGIMAQAQLDSEQCDRELIGTGPFELVDWRVNDRLVAQRFDNYWREAPEGDAPEGDALDYVLSGNLAGEPRTLVAQATDTLPYIDEIEYRPIPDDSQRLNALEGGQIDAMHDDTSSNIVTERELAEAGEIGWLESEQFTEVNYVMFNQAANSPFNSQTARLAIAHATNRDEIREVIAQNVPTVASGPFAPGADGYLEDTGFPEFDLEQARQFVAQYEQESGGPLTFSLSTTPTPVTTQTAQLLKEQWEAAGASVSIRQVEQAQLINTAIGGEFEAVIWRNHPGADPDTQYVWWHSGADEGAPENNGVSNPVNFGRINDPEIDRLLDEGRTTTDQAARVQIYEDLNRRFAEQAHNVWTTWTVWGVASTPELNGILGPALPSGAEPFPGLPTGHPVTGLWIEQ